MLLHRADVDFSICRFVKHHEMFWFSIKNILPKWLQSPVPAKKCMSFLFLSSTCSAFNKSIKQIMRCHLSDQYIHCKQQDLRIHCSFRFCAANTVYVRRDNSIQSVISTVLFRKLVYTVCSDVVGIVSIHCCATGLSLNDLIKAAAPSQTILMIAGEEYLHIHSLFLKVSVSHLNANQQAG